MGKKSRKKNSKVLIWTEDLGKTPNPPSQDAMEEGQQVPNESSTADQGSSSLSRRTTDEGYASLDDPSAPESSTRKKKRPFAFNSIEEICEQDSDCASSSGSMLQSPKSLERRLRGSLDTKSILDLSEVGDTNLHEIPSPIQECPDPVDETPAKEVEAEQAETKPVTDGASIEAQNEASVDAAPSLSKTKDEGFQDGAVVHESSPKAADNPLTTFAVLRKLSSPTPSETELSEHDPPKSMPLSPTLSHSDLATSEVIDGIPEEAAPDQVIEEAEVCPSLAPEPTTVKEAVNDHEIDDECTLEKGEYSAEPKDEMTQQLVDINTGVPGPEEEVPAGKEEVKNEKDASESEATLSEEVQSEDVSIEPERSEALTTKDDDADQTEAAIFEPEAEPETQPEVATLEDLIDKDLEETTDSAEVDEPATIEDKTAAPLLEEADAAIDEVTVIEELLPPVDEACGESEISADYIADEGLTSDETPAVDETLPKDLGVVATSADAEDLLQEEQNAGESTAERHVADILTDVVAESTSKPDDAVIEDPSLEERVGVALPEHTHDEAATSEEHVVEEPAVEEPTAEGGESLGLPAENIPTEQAEDERLRDQEVSHGEASAEAQPTEEAPTEEDEAVTEVSVEEAPVEKVSLEEILEEEALVEEAIGAATPDAKAVEDAVSEEAVITKEEPVDEEPADSRISVDKGGVKEAVPEKLPADESTIEEAPQAELTPETETSAAEPTRESKPGPKAPPQDEDTSHTPALVATAAAGAAAAIVTHKVHKYHRDKEKYWEREAASPTSSTGKTMLERSRDNAKPFLSAIGRQVGKAKEDRDRRHETEEYKEKHRRKREVRENRYVEEAGERKKVKETTTKEHEIRVAPEHGTTRRREESKIEQNKQKKQKEVEESQKVAEEESITTLKRHDSYNRPHSRRSSGGSESTRPILLKRMTTGESDTNGPLFKINMAKAGGYGPQEAPKGAHGSPPLLARAETEYASGSGTDTDRRRHRQRRRHHSRHGLMEESTETRYGKDENGAPYHHERLVRRVTSNGIKEPSSDRPGKLIRTNTGDRDPPGLRLLKNIRQAITGTAK